PNLKSAFHAQFGIDSAGEVPEKLTDRSIHARLLNTDGRIAEARGELQRIDAISVDDTIHVDIAHVTFFGELRLHFLQRLIEKLVGHAPEHGSSHFAGGRAEVSWEELFVLEVYINGMNELLAVKKCPHGNFHARYAPL